MRRTLSGSLTHAALTMILASVACSDRSLATTEATSTARKPNVIDTIVVNVDPITEKNPLIGQHRPRPRHDGGAADPRLQRRVSGPAGDRL